MKKAMLLVAALSLLLGQVVGCSNRQDEFISDNNITVVSREDGSGTRGAFVELFGVEEKDSNGDKVDNTTLEASITNNTSVMMATVQNDIYAIGYASLGSLNDNVKTVKIDGVSPTADNIKNGKYTVSRPFNIAVRDDLSDTSKDYIQYILSVEGQKVVQDTGYIPINSNDSYKSKNLSGKVVVAGSSSVSPVMEKLKEAYIKLNPDVKVEIQTSDSTTGVTGAIEKICDIGISSRNLTESELSSGLNEIKIALDGIVIITNKENKFDNLSKENVKDIYIGNAINWSDL